MPIVNFVNEKKQIQAPEGANLRAEARKVGIGLYPGPHKYLNCHGNGLCGSCRVLITKGIENASEMAWMERSQLNGGLCSLLNGGLCSMAFIGHEDSMRLACKTQVNGDMDVVTKPPLDLYGENFFS